MPDRAIMRFLTTRAWALHLPVLQALVDVVNRHARLEKAAPEQIDQIVALREQRRVRVRRERSAIGNGSRLIAQSLFGDDRDEMVAVTERGVGVIFVDGVLCKYADQINGISQPQGTCTADLIDAVHAMGNAGNVRAIVLDIDSPGGTVPGMDDVAEAIRQVADGGKPVIAYAHDLCASGGYFVAASCDEIWCNPSAEVGSVGVYTVVDDESEWLESMGVKRIVVRTDPDKGIGVPGSRISEDQVKVLQAEIDALGDWFKGHVAARRGMSLEAVRALGARVYVGPAAVELGLADGTAGFAEFIRAVEDEVSVGAA